MNVNEITSFLESIAPLAYQESYDNSGLLVGNPAAEVSGVLISLDCTEEVVDEAIAKNCNLVISHHPIVFKGLKQLVGKNYVERTVIKAIKNDVALYAIHTNLDSVFKNGVNTKIAERLGLAETRILQPKSNLLYKLSVFVPQKQAETLKNALFTAGAGHIGEYSHCSFTTEGTGSFLPQEGTQPFVGTQGSVHHETETKIEVIVPKPNKNRVEQAMRAAHPYEEVAFDWYALENTLETVGSGMVGRLDHPMSTEDFLTHVKEKLQTDCIRYTPLTTDKPIEKVAICGGSGSFLLKNAKQQGADAFITGDFKYHEFFDAEGTILITDVGHYESEQFTSELLSELLREKFSTFAIRLSEVNTNPINYFK